MPKHSAAPSVPAQLRVSAEERLRHGTAPPTYGWPAGTQALSLLHSMAATPSSASDALKVLHELQVHQIELDLQKEQADQNRSQLTQAQAHYFALFDQAPFAYLTLNANFEVMDTNHLAREWLGPLQHASPMKGIHNFLARDCWQAAHDALGRLRDGSRSETFVARHRTQGGNMRVSATAAPGGQLIYMTLIPIGLAAGH